MSSLAEIQKQIAELQAQAKAIIENEKSNVIEEIKAKISQYGITANELGFKSFDNLSEISVVAGIWLKVLNLLSMGFPPTKSQIYFEKLPNSS